MYLPFFARTEKQLDELSENLEKQVHIISWHYHWNRDDVLTLPVRLINKHIKLIGETLEKKNKASKGKTPSIKKPRRPKR